MNSLCLLNASPTPLRFSEDVRPTHPLIVEIAQALTHLPSQETFHWLQQNEATWRAALKEYWRGQIGIFGPCYCEATFVCSILRHITSKTEHSYVLITSGEGEDLTQSLHSVTLVYDLERWALYDTTKGAHNRLTMGHLLSELFAFSPIFLFNDREALWIHTTRPDRQFD